MLDRKKKENPLRDLPSSGTQDAPPVHSPLFSRPRKKGKRRGRFWSVFVVLLIGAPLFLIIVLQSGYGSRILAREASAVVARVLPETHEATIRKTFLVPDGLNGLAVSLDGFEIAEEATGEVLLAVEKTTLGLRTLSLLSGEPQVKSINFQGATYAMPPARSGTPDWPAVESVEDALTAVVDLLDHVLSRTVINGTPVDISIRDLKLSGLSPLTGGEIEIVAASLRGTGALRQVDADILFSGQPVRLSGSFSKSRSGAVAVRLNAEGVPLPLGRLHTMLSANPDDHQPGSENKPIPARIAIDASRPANGSANAFTIAITPSDLQLKLDEGDLVPLSGTFAFRWDPDARVLRLDDSPIRLGRSSAVLSGALRDAPDLRSGDPRLYQFQLVANRGISDPRDSPSNGVRFGLFSEGLWHPKSAFVEFRDIRLNSTSGHAEGAGTLDFAASVPTAVFAISISDFAIAGVKQFWPASIARGARRWVLANLAGGRVTSGDFLIAEPLRRRIPGVAERLTGDTDVSLRVSGVRFDVTGDIPPVRDAIGSVEFKNGITTIRLDSGTAYMRTGRTAEASDGTLVIHPQQGNGEVYADLDLFVSGSADAIGEIISLRPINARSFRDYKPEELSGDVVAEVKMRFLMNPSVNSPPPEWDVTLDLEGVSIAALVEGRRLSGMTGTVEINRQRAEFDVNGNIDGLPAEIAMILPFGDNGISAQRDIVLKLADEDRSKIAPGLETILRGTTPVRVSGENEAGAVSIKADLTSAALSLPWLGWSKGPGIEASTAFDLLLGDSETRLSDFSLEGKSFSAEGDLTVSPTGLLKARLPRVRLNPTDDVSVDIHRKGRGYSIAVEGSSFDARSLLRHARSQMSAPPGEGKGTPVEVRAEVASVAGFGDEVLRNVTIQLRHDGINMVALSASGTTASGFPVSFNLEGAGADRQIRGESLDAGAILRFLDIYGQIRGGVARLALAGRNRSTLAGNVRLTDFRVFNEPRLRSLVSTKAAKSQSLNEAIRRDIDTSEVKFDTASAKLVIGPSSLAVEEGIVRGPLVGSTFQGTVIDKQGMMRITGTFLPAYGLNSLFAEIPILGLFLGNGRDRGLIGVTYLLEGDAKKPEVYVNPLSVIAPGVFRSIFEYR